MQKLNRGDISYKINYIVIRTRILFVVKIPTKQREEGTSRRLQKMGIKLICSRRSRKCEIQFTCFSCILFEVSNYNNITNCCKKMGALRTEFTIPDSIEKYNPQLKIFLIENIVKNEGGFRTEFTIPSYKIFPDIGKYKSSCKNISYKKC